jgi:DNA-binding transcriptional MerR regulator
MAQRPKEINEPLAPVGLSTGPADGFRGKQVCAIVGITYRQLDYWARTDLLRPSLVDATGSGSQRRYSYADVLELKVIKRLLDAGLKLQQARQAVECLRGDLGVDLASAQLVLADSRSILATSGGELVDLLAGGQGVFNVLPLAGVVSELEAAIVELNAEATKASKADQPSRDERHPAAAYLAAGGTSR